MERILRLRVPITILYLLLVPLAAWKAAHMPSEGGIDRLVRADDPDFVATRAFERIFPDSPSVLLIFEAPDPFSAENVARVDATVAALRKIPHVSAFSLLDAVRRVHLDPRKAAAGTTYFAKQGLVGADFLSVVAEFDARERDQALRAIDAVLPKGVRRVGAPYVESWIEAQSGAASAHYFPFFGALVVVATLLLYRSLRTLLAFLLSLASAVALSVAAGGLLGFAFSIISVLVPLTVLVTTLASLVYLHSRYVDRDPSEDLQQHQLLALRNKLLPVSASTLAAVLGFAALAVSPLRPIREMGLWTALGLSISWLVAFTLFPSLQRILRTPTRSPKQRGPGEWLAAHLPDFSRRHRFALVGSAIAMCIVGAIALRGMAVGIDTVTYLDPRLPIRQDIEWFRAHVGDLNAAHVWIHLPQPTATSPETLRAVDDFQQRIEKLPDVIAATGPTTFLRLRRYFAGQGEALPADLGRASADLEQLLLTETSLRGYVDVGLQDLQITVLFKQGNAQGYAALASAIHRAAGSLDARIVGNSLVTVKIGASLVPTLAQSFAITAALIFVVFLFVFRSASARLLAMIPSLFAILVTFLGMRLLSVPLNLATILIATTVLGTTETDQVHFFHHLHERDDAPLSLALAHALRVSGGAIVFATVINAAGFLALAFSSFPPLRQFGVITSSAFVLALLADFTALPAGLWLTRRGRG